MEILEQNHGAVAVIKPQGPLTQDDALQFRQQVRQTLGQTLGRFLIDASAVAFVDSAALEMLAETCEELAQSGLALKLCGANQTLREVLDLTELSGLFEFYEDVNTAVRSFL